MYVYGLTTLLMLLTSDIDIPECDNINGNCKHNCVETMDNIYAYAWIGNNSVNYT